MKFNEKVFFDMIEKYKIDNVIIHGLFKDFHFKTLKIDGVKKEYSIETRTDKSDKPYSEQTQNEIDGIEKDELLTGCTKAEFDKIRIEMNLRKYRIKWTS